MANRLDYTTIEMPVVLRDRLARMRIHDRQAMYEVVEEAVEWLEECLRITQPGPRIDPRFLTHAPVVESEASVE